MNTNQNSIIMKKIPSFICTNAPKGAVACQLNNTNFNYDIPPMENSAGATIYDVWLQTSLDD